MGKMLSGLRFFNQMTYREQYYQIIDFRRQNPVPCNEYSEKHHIVPRSLGGPNRAENLVRLTAAEHYKVHCILPFMYKEEGNVIGYEKMLYAWKRIANRPADMQPDLSSMDDLAEIYQTLKIEYVKLFRKRRLGTKMSKEAKHKMHLAHLGKSPANKGVPATKEQIEKNRRWHIGKTSPRKGAKLSEDTKRKLSESHRGRSGFTGKHHSEDTKRKIREINSEMHWYNNGKRNVRAKDCPEGFVPGRILR